MTEQNTLEPLPWQLPVADIARMLAGTDFDGNPENLVFLEDQLQQLRNQHPDAFDVIIARVAGWTAQEYGATVGLTYQQAESKWTEGPDYLSYLLHEQIMTDQGYDLSFVRNNASKRRIGQSLKGLLRY